MSGTDRWGGAASAPKLTNHYGDGRPATPGVARRTRYTDRNWLEEETAAGAVSLRLSPGDMVPGTKYRVVRRIGVGGMGIVYEGVHTATDRQAALKVMRREVSDNPAVVRMFRQEARLASQIGSEYIVQALDFTELPAGRLMYVMEYVDGQVVDDELGSGPLPPARCIAILRQVARALADAHAAGVIHRDIKPENVMLERGGERSDRVRLLDFGISLIASGLHIGAHDTVGTPHFLAPEVILGEAATPASDLYALGCTAYEMLTGYPPFDAPEIAQVLRMQVEAPAPLMPGVPAPLSQVVLRCLNKKPEDRFADMRDFEAALIEAQLEAGIVTEWDHLPPPAVDPDRRAALVAALADTTPARGLRWPAFALMGALVLGIGGVVLAVATSGDDTETTDDDDAAELHAIEAATQAAREAALAGRFVYPPHDQPSATTAYGEILKLEARGTPEAKTRAAELRLELGGQLRRVADHYWKLRPESPLVAEYYAEVLMFIPHDPVALHRSGLADDELERRRQEVSEGALSVEQLADLEPLMILAHPDATSRKSWVERYRKSVEDLDRPPKYAAEFDALLVVRSPYDDEAPVVEPVLEGEAEGDAESETEGDTEQADLDDLSEADRKLEATRLAEAGQRALRQGNTQSARKNFEAALLLNSRLSVAHDGLAQVYFARSNFRKAASYAKKAVAFSPGNLDYRVRLGDALYRLDELEEALRHYNKAAEGGRADAERRAEKIRKKL